jgi:cell shape-determining protein MreD
LYISLACSSFRQSRYFHRISPKFLAALIGATALVGVVISTYITIQAVRTDMTNYTQDYLAYGLLPSVAYLVLLVAAVSIYLEGCVATLAGMAGRLKRR